MPHDENGREIPDQTPVEWPLGVRRPETLTEQIRRLVRSQISQEAAAQGMETFEEADDFDLDEDPDPVSAYEVRELIPEGNLPPEPPDGGGSPGEPAPPP